MISIPAVRGSRLTLTWALKIGTFLEEFNGKSICFRSRPLVGVSWRSPWRLRSILFLMNILKNRYSSIPAARSPESRLALAPALKIDVFLNQFN